MSRFRSVVTLSVSLALANPAAAQEGLAVLALDAGRLADRATIAAGGWAGSWHYGSDNEIRGVGDLDADGRDDAIVTSDWGIGVVRHDGTAWRSLITAANGTAFGSWAFNSRDARIQRVADFDGDGSDDVLITSRWGVGILELAAGALRPLMMHPNGTRFGGWAFSSIGNTIHEAGDFDGDGRADLLVTSGWGVALLTLRGTTLAPLAAAANGTRFGNWAFDSRTNRIHAVADFDGNGRDDVLVSSGWGVAVLTLGSAGVTTLAMHPNGTRFGGWAFDSRTNQIQGVGDFDGDDRADLLISSPWGVGIVTLRGTTFTHLMMQPNGTRFGGWAFEHRRDTIHGIADLDGNGRDDIVIRSSWGTGLLTLRGSTLDALGGGANETNLGRWRLQARDRVVGIGSFVGGPAGSAQVLIQKGPAELPGFVDLHTHPMARWAFGAELFWGDVEGDPVTALGKCQCFHRGWDVSNTCGNTYREELVNTIDEANAHHHTGDGSGFTQFQSFPKHDSTLHQQMWHEWIRRARDGGLRVMVALAVNSHATADAGETRGPNDDLGSMSLQLAKLRDFVDHQHALMEIARSPADVRRIVAAGRLAVVVGVEMDNIGNFYDPADPKGAGYNPNPSDADVQREIDRLYTEGVRYIFPIHITNNAFGGAALYDSWFNVANKYNTGSSFQPEVVDTRATGIAFKLEPPSLELDAIGAIAFRITGPVLPQRIMPSRPRNYPDYPDPGPGLGHRNRVGLSERGEFAVRYMMRKGMLIDIDHMSELAVEEILQIAEPFDYPLSSGHNGPRGTAGNENQRTRAHYVRIRDLGGIIGLGHGGEATRFWGTLDRVRYDLAAERGQVAIGTDVNGLFPLPGPPAPAARVASVPGLAPSRLGAKTWAYDTDGFAHYGMFPEFIQSLRNAGMTAAAADSFFRSAEYFTRMWEKAERRRDGVTL